MVDTIRFLIESLFVNPDKTGQSVRFSWYLIRRKGRPFILLPTGLVAARAGLSLYSAQRLPAKIGRALLPVMLQTPAVKFFEPVCFEASVSSEIMQFLARQSRIPNSRIILSSIKLNEVGKRSRLVLLMADESGRPTSVIKAGINASGKADTDQEADFLETLPPNTIGCIRMTGRIKGSAFSAFATDYFPGESPRTDAGMEYLFHAWLNHEPVIPLESLPTWRELDAAATQAAPHQWLAVKGALAGKSLRATLYHGDFAPWNIRAVNSQNLQAFDWERGQLQGIPSWDWFHFTIQTAILVKRHPTERVAAEVEQLIQSERFQTYAAAANISDIVEPLVLAYLLHHRWVIQPMEGRQAAARLFEFLSAHWGQAAAIAAQDTNLIQRDSGWLRAARRQLRAVFAQWFNLFWEPTLNSTNPISFLAQFRAHWGLVGLTALLLATIAWVQFYSDLHLMFLPFYLAVCALITWKADRRWGVLTAVLAAVTAPILVSFRDTGFRQTDVLVWNSIMRALILYFSVLLVDRIHKQNGFSRHRDLVAPPLPRLANSWAIGLFCSLTLVVVAKLDFITDPHLIFLPLYLFPCMILTLALNLRWGIFATLVATGAGCWIEYVTNKLSHYSLAEVFIWNFLMRTAVSLVVLMLLDRIRKENILFSQRKTNPN
jgi:hypothetical protein